MPFRKINTAPAPAAEAAPAAAKPAAKAAAAKPGAAAAEANAITLLQCTIEFHFLKLTAGLSGGLRASSGARARSNLAMDLDGWPKILSVSRPKIEMV